MISSTRWISGRKRKRAMRSRVEKEEKGKEQ